MKINYSFTDSVLIFLIIGMIESCLPKAVLENSSIEINNKIDSICNKWQTMSLAKLDSLGLIDKKFDQNLLKMFRSNIEKRCAKDAVGINVRHSFLEYTIASKIFDPDLQTIMLIENEYSGEIHFWKYYLFSLTKDSVTCYKFIKTNQPWELQTPKTISLKRFEKFVENFKHAANCEPTGQTPCVMSTFKDDFIDVNIVNMCIQMEDEIESLFLI